MRIESKLCHVSENKVVVRVDAWINDKKVGSSLAEGPTAEIAEDKAISRLNKRINEIDNNETKINFTNKTKYEKEGNLELANSNKQDSNNVIPEPSDWSNELIAIDTEIERLGWSRDDEIIFLEKTLGYNNRSKITKYDELVSYLKILKNINKSNLNKTNSGDKNSLIEESDIILKELSWNKNQGREYLLKEFNVSTRFDLDEKQLLKFIANLKEIRNQYMSM